MGFLLIPNSVTLNDFERRNSIRLHCVISVALGAHYVNSGLTCTDTFCSRNVAQRI